MLLRTWMRILNKISRLARNPLWCSYLWHLRTRVDTVSDVYSYSFGLHRYLIKKSDHNDKLLSIEATFGFCMLYKSPFFLITTVYCNISIQTLDCDWTCMTLDSTFATRQQVWRQSLYELHGEVRQSADLQTRNYGNHKSGNLVGVGVFDWSKC